MNAEIGLFFLILAFSASVLQAAYLFTHQRLRGLLLPCLPTAASVQMLSMLLSFAMLIVLRLDSDFTVSNVVLHSNLTLPTLYKVVGTWGNHEGSLLLWGLLLSCFSAAFCKYSLVYSSADTTRSAGNEDPALNAAALTNSVLAIVFAGFTLFMLTTSNPFARLFPPPVDGQALNPLLQDIALAMHPPLLYAGYVGFSVVFAMAVAALLQGRMGREWAIAAHPWILVAWSALTLGIGLGSWWAYRVLGWGGWWFWDPVENCSLLPWLCGTALLHANIVLKKRGMLGMWVSLLAIMTFAMSLLATFLVRSGVLTSVHSFASDPARGLFILAYITIIIGGALLLFGLRAGTLESQEKMKPLSREGMIVINNLFLLCACATVLLGTLYPMMVDLTGGSPISVGAPYFNATFLPIMAVPLFFAGLVPFMAWKKASWAQATRAALPAALASGAAATLVFAFAKTQATLAAMGFALAAWLLASSVRWVMATQGRGAASVFIAHSGAAVLIAGITGAGLWKEEASKLMLPGEILDIASYHLTFEQSSLIERPNHTARSIQLIVTDENRHNVTVLYPEYRSYAIRNITLSEPAIASLWLNDLYVVVGETDANNKTAVRAYYNPMVWLLWLGCALMALGGMIAIFQRMRNV